jgi:hypothetical protein
VSAVRLVPGNDDDPDRERAERKAAAPARDNHAARDDDDEDEGDRRTTNIIIGLAVAAVIGLGIWLVGALLEQRRIDDCAAQGRRNCAPITTPGR